METYSNGLRLIFLISPLTFFSFNLFSLDAAVGLVFVRRFGFWKARWSRSTKRFKASSRFCSCVRYFFASISNSPSVVILLPATCLNRALTSSGRDELFTPNRNCTAVATLFTFCPPGPEARTKANCSSLSSIAKDGVIWIMNLSIPLRMFKTFARVQTNSP